MPTINLPPKFRIALYALIALGSPVMVYLDARHIVGQLEMNLWLAEAAVVSAMAALNVTDKKEK
jgi:hypothetical protein